MLHKIIVRSGSPATQYLLTHRFYQWDPFECRPPGRGKETILMSPFTSYFYWDCLDEINYPNHLWDILSKMGEIAGRSHIPDWFEKEDVIRSLVDLTVAGHIKIWQLVTEDSKDNWN